MLQVFILSEWLWFKDFNSEKITANCQELFVKYKIKQKM